MSNTLFSIICPVFNCTSTVRRLIDSILSQSSDSYELIIVDGGSTDGTLDIIREYDGRIAYISEPDNGIYDAMNKGIRMARGEWLYFIGADDYLYSSDALAQVTPLLSSDADVLLCKIMSPKFGICTSELSRRMFTKNTVHHQGAIYRRSILISHPYDTTYRIIADYELNLHVWKNNYRVKHCDTVLAVHPATGVSGCPNFINYREEILIRNKYLTNPFCRLYYTIISIGKYACKHIGIC